MSNDLILLERQLAPLLPNFAQVLPAGLPAERLVRTVLVSCERNPNLLAPHLRASLMQAAMTAAVLGLEVDGVTGQGFIIPFGGRSPRAQFIPGYKGYNTMAARAGYTINGGIVREGDQFEYEEGSSGFVRHKRQLGGEAARKIIAAWATATAEGRAPIVAILSLDELLATKAKSAGAKKADSPWNDPAIGFAAMCEKTAKRRLARSMPLGTLQLAAALESVHDTGRTAHITERAELIIDGDAEIAPEATPPSAEDLTSPGSYAIHFEGKRRELPTVEQWIGAIDGGIKHIGKDLRKLKTFQVENMVERDRIAETKIDAALWFDDAFDTAFSLCQ